MTPPIRIGIIGYGKIARDQHIPAIQASQDFQLAAISDPKPSDDAEAPFFQDYADMLAAQIVDAVAICTPPRSEEHTSELQSLMRISYAVFCLKKKHTQTQITRHI